MAFAILEYQHNPTIYCLIQIVYIQCFQQFFSFTHPQDPFQMKNL